MKKIIFILLVILNLVNYAQRGQTIPKGNSTPTQDKPSVNEKKSEKPNSNIITITVSATTVPCSNNVETQCLQIKRQGSAEYETVDDIENFPYELNYIYTIQVKEIIKSSTTKYVFVKQLSKKEIVTESNENPAGFVKTITDNGKVIGKTQITTNSPLDGKWYLRKMKDTDGTSIITDDNIMYIEINIFNDRIDGFGACNKFATVVQSDNNTKFIISKLTTDYGNCGNKKIEDLFYSVLQQVDKFELRNSNLILSKQWNFLLGFTKNPDNKEEIPITYTPPNIVKNDNTTYATNQNTNTNQDVYIPPVISKDKTETTTSSVSTTNTDEQQTASKETSITNNAEVDEMQRKIDELQKALEAKKQKAEDDAKKAEAAKLAAAKAIEAKKQEQQQIESKEAILKKQAEELAFLKQQLEEKNKKEEVELEQKNQTELTKQKAQQQKEIDALKKKEELQQQQIKVADQKKPTQSNTEKSIIKQEDIAQNATSNSNFENPRSDEYFIYSKNDKNIINLENDIATFKGTEKNTFLELEKDESTLQFFTNKIPKIIIKLNVNEKPENYISLYTCDFKKDKRIAYVRPSKNKVLTSYSLISENEYEIVLPENLGEGEYVFVKQSDINSQITINTSTSKVFAFGITYK